MNDKRMQSLLDTWYRDREVPRPEVRTGVARVMADVPQTRQRSRLWPFPVLHRKVQTPTATETAEYHPIPIPASNGHTPTVIGRTTSMLNPVKAIAAGAIVFAIGGVMLITEPFSQPSVVPGADVATPPPPVEFSGRWLHGPQVVDSTVEVVDGNIVEAGAVFRPEVTEMSDPRLEGVVTITPNAITYGGETGPVLWHKAFRIENEDGAWQEEPSFTMFSPDGSGWDWTSVLVGEGDYEGLIAIANVHHDNDAGYWSLEGYVVDGDLPATPQS